MSIVLNDNLKIEAPKLIDERFGPHSNLGAALAFITPALREMGLIFFVKDGSNLLEYWWPTTDLSDIGIALRSYQPLDADLTAIANIIDGGTGFLKKTAPNTWSLDTTVVTASTIAGGELEGYYPNPTLKNSAVIGKVLTGFNTVGGGTILATDSILQAFGKVQNQLNALYGGMQFINFWDASTNTPTIPAASLANKGNYYIVQVAGSFNLDDITDWKVGDWAVSNGSVWSKIDNTDAVVSVNGYTGAVNLTTSDIAEGSNLYYTDLRVKTYADTLYSVLGHTHTFASLTSKPTTIGGYGITDAYIKSELDNFFAGIVGITGYNKTNWDLAYGWGNHALAGYVKGTGIDQRIPYFNSTDTVTTSSRFVWNTTLNALLVNNGIAGTIGATLSGAFDGGSLQVWNGHELAVMGSNVGNSGDVATMIMKSNRGVSTANGYIEIQGYYAGGTNNAPIILQRQGGVIIIGNIAAGADTTSLLQVNGPIRQTSVTSALLKASGTGVLQAAVAGTDYLVSADLSNYYTQTQIQNFFSGASAITGYNKSNWDTAYGWGNHASAGYITAAYQYYIGTTLNALNRASGAQTLTGVSIDGNAGTATTFSTYRMNYKGVTDQSVAGQLMWKEYGNNHTIFDASDGTAPDGTAVDSQNSAVPWAGTYPTLMGWNGSSTYGVRVDSARIADTVVNGVYTSRTLTINGNAQNLSADRTWNVGTVTSISGTGTVSGLSLSGTVTTSGNITLGGTLTLTAAQVNAVGGITNNTTGTAASLSAVLSSSLGGAGSVNGILKANGSGLVSAASAGADYTLLNGTGFVRMSGTTPSYVTGTSSQFVKADGSLDGTPYATAASLSGYLPLSGGTLTGALSGTSLSMSGGGSFGGNVGIGVTPSAWETTWKVLQLAGGSVYVNAGGTTGQIGLAQNWFFDGSNNRYLNSAAASDYYQFGGLHVWRTAPSGTAGNPITFTERMRITSAGNLLIKTTTDNGTDALQVAGSGLFSGSLKLSTAGSKLNFDNALRYILPVDGSDFFVISQNAFASGIKIGFDNGTSFTPSLTFATTGAATFSSSVTAANFYGNASSATLVTHLSARTDGTFYNVIWGAGSPSYLYSCDAVQIRSSDGRLKASSMETTGDIYLGTRSVWLSSWLNQAVKTTDNVTFNYITGTAGGGDSDLTLKNVITRGVGRSIADMLEMIKYTWKDAAKGTGERYGYGAQDLLNILPEAVYKVEGKGTYAVEYGMVHTVVLDEHTRRIQALEKDNMNLKQQVAELQSQLNNR